MFKFIVTAKNPTDSVALMMHTATVDLYKVEWNLDSLTRSEEDAHVDNFLDLGDWVKKGEWGKMDDAIMSGDVPTGSMVVVCDEEINPYCGYVCGNGNEWFKVFLPHKVQVAILKKIHPTAKYFVLGGFRTHVLENKTDLGEWLEEGFAACEGSEQMRYASMMNQLDAGKTVIDYDA